LKLVIEKSLAESQQALEVFRGDAGNIENIRQSAKLLITILDKGGSIYSCGNGGSMSDAMHFAEELSGRYRKNRPGMSAHAISDPGHISCIANDYGYEYVFSRYLEANVRKGDCLLAISTSGTSKNVIKAAEYARNNNIAIIALTGKQQSVLGELATVNVSTFGDTYADRVQEVHIKIIHILIELIERYLFPENYAE
jgi:D-sedoheptulose 7-phosphate isomerase